MFSALHAIPVDDATRVAEVRRVALSVAQAEGLTEQACQEAALIATEAATNLLKHARGGEAHVSALSPTGRSGVEILAIDRGPGMANMAACLADGYSTTGTAGTGLGAISRLADVFDGYSQPGRGTVTVARKFRGDRSYQRTSDWTFGAVRVPYAGEAACGDQWGVRAVGSDVWIMMADGLGHGILAADAANQALEVFSSGHPATVIAMLEKIHLALRPTRGAAVAVTMIHEGRARHAGLGNISAVLLGGTRPQVMVSHNGTAGLEARRFQEFEYALPANAVVVMHSDGISASWSMESYPGLLRRHPSIIAGTLYRDANRGRDDACVLVGALKWE